MKIIKKCLIISTLLIAGLSHANDNIKLRELAINDVMQENFKVFKTKDEIPVYDYDNKVPPSFETIVNQVGKKNELTVFVSKQSIRYLYYFMSDHSDAVEYRKTYYRGILTGENQVKTKADTETGRVDKAFIKKLEFYENGILVTIDIEKSPFSEFIVEDETSDFSVTYTYGHGYVLKADLETVIRSKNDPDGFQTKYVLDLYKNTVTNKGYSYRTLSGYFYDDTDYKKDDSIVNIRHYVNKSDYRYLMEFENNTVNMEFYTRETYADYAQLVEKLKMLDQAEKYKKLHRILQN